MGRGRGVEGWSRERKGETEGDRASEVERGLESET